MRACVLRFPGDGLNAGLDRAMDALFQDRVEFETIEADLSSLGPLGARASSRGVAGVAEDLARRSDIVLVASDAGGLAGQNADLVYRVLRRAKVPVLVVSEAMIELPDRLLVGIDFRSASLNALQLARRLLPRARVHLAHVEDRERGRPSPGFGKGDSDTAALLSAVATQSGVDPDQVVFALLAGPTAETLLTYASERKIAVIAIGSANTPGFRGTTISSRLMVEPGMSVLITPRHS